MSFTGRHVEMMRIGMTLAVVVLGGGVLAAGKAGACEMHRARAGAAEPTTQPSTPPSAEPSARPSSQKASTDGAAVDPAPSDERHAAKCQCGSAADCTCKKGTCQCARCKKHRQDEQPPVEAEIPLTAESTLAA